MLKIQHKIPTLEQCREICKVKPEFREINKGDYIVFDYMLSDGNTFDDPMSLEMRGIAFHPDGTLAGLGLHKFFNYGEKPVELCLDGTEEVLEKLDGSMIRVIKLTEGGVWTFGTRAGETDVSDLADNYIASLNTSSYDAFIEVCLEEGLWPIFEFWSPGNAVVVKYPEPFLKVIAIRTSEGHYWEHHEVKSFAAPFGLECAEYSSHGFMKTLADYPSMKGIEGFVVRTNTGWCKLKTDEYRQLHKAIEGVKFDKDVVRMILDGTIDDALPLIPEPRKSEVEELRKSVVEYTVTLEWHIQSVAKICASLIAMGVSRKDIVTSLGDSKVRSQILAVIDGRDSSDQVKNILFKASATTPLWNAFAKENLK